MAIAQKAPHQYVLRGRRAPDADRGRRSPPGGAGGGDGVGASPSPGRGERHVAGAEVGEPLLPLPLRAAAGHLGGQVGAVLGERLSAGHQAGPTAVLQRGHRVPPPGPTRREGQRRTSREPVQSDRDLYGRQRSGQPVRGEEWAVCRYEQPWEVIRNEFLPRGVHVQGEPAGQQLQRLRVDRPPGLLRRPQQTWPPEARQPGDHRHDRDALPAPDMTRRMKTNKKRQ